MGSLSHICHYQHWMKSASLDPCLEITYCQVLSWKYKEPRKIFLLFFSPSLLLLHPQEHTHPHVWVCVHACTYTQKASVLIPFSQLLCTITNCRCSKFQARAQFCLSMKYMINMLEKIAHLLNRNIQALNWPRNTELFQISFYLWSLNDQLFEDTQCWFFFLFFFF